MERTPALLALAIGLGACAAPRASITPRIGNFDIDGELGITEASTNTSLNNDLQQIGLTNDHGVFSGRVDVEWGSPHLTLALSDSTHGGDGFLSAELRQGGITIPVNASVSSEVDVTLGEAILTFDLVPSEAFELGLGFGVSVIDLAASITSIDTGDRVSANETIPAPILALRLGTRLGPVELSGLLGGISVDYSDVKAQVVDLDLMGRLQVLKGATADGHLSLGWRQLNTDLEYRDGGDHVDAHFDLSGPYLGFTLGF